MAQGEGRLLPSCWWLVLKPAREGGRGWEGQLLLIEGILLLADFKLPTWLHQTSFRVRLSGEEDSQPAARRAV